jgi:predicted dehydrogenase
MYPFSRRQLLAGAAALAPAAAQQTVRARPSDRITVGVIGAGPRGMYVLSHFLKDKDIQVVAVCDCFADRRAAAKALVDQHNGDTGCASYRFHEEILGRPDIDAVLIATGDRWHSVLSVLAARAGKDVYCEKPISLTVAEGRAMAETMKRYGTVWQCGTQRKSIPGYGFAREVVRSGRIGKLHTITTSFGDGPWRNDALPITQPAPDPDVFDYDRWLGQAPWAPYSPVRVKLWRLHWDTSAGPVADMGPHYFEFAQWVRGDELGGPVEFEGEGEFRRDPKFNTIPYWVNIRARYADGMRLNMDSGPKGVRFDGDEGWIHLMDDGKVTADPKSVLAGLTVPEADWKVMAPHIRDFVESVRTRRLTVSSPEIAQRAHTICHAANLTLRLARPLRWDPQAELFLGDDEANNMLARTMRSPWTI